MKLEVQRQLIVTQKMPAPKLPLKFCYCPLLFHEVRLPSTLLGECLIVLSEHLKVIQAKRI